MVFAAISLVSFVGSLIVGSPPAPVPVEPYRAAFDSMNDGQIHSAWVDMMSRNRVYRPPSPQELTVQRRFKIATVAAGGLRALAAVAAVVAIAVGAWRLSCGRGQSRQLSTKL